FGRGGVRGGVDFLRLERAGAAGNDVEGILRGDADAEDVAHHPVVGQRFWPHRIDLEARRLDGGLGLCGRGLLEQLLRDAETREQYEQQQPDEKITSPPHASTSIRKERQYTTGVPRIKHGLWLMADGMGRMARPSTLAISHQPLAILAAPALLVLWAAAGPAAHDIPNDVTVQTFLKPEGQRLPLLRR